MLPLKFDPQSVCTVVPGRPDVNLSGKIPKTIGIKFLQAVDPRTKLEIGDVWGGARSAIWKNAA